MATTEDFDIARGHNHSRSRFRCDLAVRRSEDPNHRVAVLVDSAERAQLAAVEEQSSTHDGARQFGLASRASPDQGLGSQPDSVLRSIEDSLTLGDVGLLEKRG